MRWELIVLLMFLVACAKPAMPAEQVEPKVDVVAKTEPVKPAPAELGIGEAVQLGKPIKCIAMQAGQTTTLYMKGSKMRMDTLPADAHGIYTEELMYTWQGKQGSVMKLADIKAMSAGDVEQYKPKTQSEIIENAQKFNARCESYDVPESMFAPPADVQFQDLTAMLKQLESIAAGLQK